MCDCAAWLLRLSSCCACSADLGGGRNRTAAFGCPYPAAASPGDVFAYGNEHGVIGRDSCPGQGQLPAGAQPLRAEGQLGSTGAGPELCAGAHGCDGCPLPGWLCSHGCLGNCCVSLLLIRCFPVQHLLFM